MSWERIAIAGLGLLGRGIAACFLVHGFRVVVYSSKQSDYAGARQYIENAVREFVEAGEREAALSTEWTARYHEAASIGEFDDCTFVVESVPEDVAIKQSVFDQIEDVVATDVPIASNTSALPITLLQAMRRHPGRFLGMHWAEPAYVTRFLELIRGTDTSDAAMEAAADLARRTGKDSCIVQKDVPGFIVNRLGYAMYREAIHLLESGVGDVETIDRCFRNAFGLWASLCGPFRWIDITGGPALYASVMQRILPSLCSSTELPETMRKMLDGHWLGAQDGRGFYSYDGNEAAKWENTLHRQAWAMHNLRRGGQQ